MQRLFDWIAKIPSTPVAFVVAWLGLVPATAAVSLWNFLHNVPIGAGYEAWLIFVASVCGIDRAGFAAKRATEWKPPRTESGVVTAEPIDEARGAKRLAGDWRASGESAGRAAAAAERFDDAP